MWCAGEIKSVRTQTAHCGILCVHDYIILVDL